jgi:hypothetical protein
MSKKSVLDELFSCYEETYTYAPRLPIPNTTKKHPDSRIISLSLFHNPPCAIINQFLPCDRSDVNFLTYPHPSCRVTKIPWRGHQRSFAKMSRSLAEESGAAAAPLLLLREEVEEAAGGRRRGIRRRCRRGQKWRPGG